MKGKGAFLSFEGIDGSGKTTQLERLTAHLRGLGREVIVAQEPGGTRIGLEIRRLLLDSLNFDLKPTTELLLYFASRAQNIEEVIRPALEKGIVVIADRFTDATVAYQGYGRGLGVEAVRSIERFACGGVKPNLTLWLDIDPAVGISRALNRNSSAAEDESRMEHENFAFFAKVRRGYQELKQAEPARIRRIDASGSVDEVESRIREVVDGFFQAH